MLQQFCLLPVSSEPDWEQITAAGSGSVEAADMEHKHRSCSCVHILLAPPPLDQIPRPTVPAQFVQMKCWVSVWSRGYVSSMSC